MKDDEKLSTKKKDKLTVISEMDELKVIANNHLLMKKYSEAIKAAEKIINLALDVKMDSLIREQEDFIASIYKIVETDKLALIILEDFETMKKKYEDLSKKNKFYDAHHLVENFKEKYGEYYNLNLIDSIDQFMKNEIKRWNYCKAEESTIKLLEPLEIQFSSYINTNNIPFAKDTLEKANKLLKSVNVDYIINKWKNFHSKYLEISKDHEFKDDFEKKLKIISFLTEEYKFKEAHSLLSLLIKISKEKGFIEYTTKLAAKKRYIEDAEGKYQKLLNDIVELDEKIKRNIKTEQYENAKENCIQIIKIARFIGKQDLIEKYEKRRDAMNIKMRDFNRFELLSNSVKRQSEIAENELNKEHFKEALAKYKDILNYIQEYFEE